jgi:hypothetical protein
METLTIPKKLTKRGDLVVIPRKEYEDLLHARKIKEFYAQLDKDLDRAIASHRRGESVGPFTSVAQLKKSLKK